MLLGEDRVKNRIDPGVVQRRFEQARTLEVIGRLWDHRDDHHRMVGPDQSRPPAWPVTLSVSATVSK